MIIGPVSVMRLKGPANWRSISLGPQSLVVTKRLYFLEPLGDEFFCILPKLRFRIFPIIDQRKIGRLLKVGRRQITEAKKKNRSSPYSFSRRTGKEVSCMAVECLVRHHM